jgi:hypothetical protein
MTRNFREFIRDMFYLVISPFVDFRLITLEEAVKEKGQGFQTEYKVYIPDRMIATLGQKIPSSKKIELFKDGFFLRISGNSQIESFFISSDLVKKI